MKSFLRKWYTTFSWIATAVLIFSTVYILIYWGVDTKLETSLLGEIIVVAALTSLACLPYWNFFERISMLGMLISYIASFIYVNAVVLTCGYFFEWFHKEDKGMLVGMEVGVLLIYVLVVILCYTSDLSMAKKMNRKLLEREKL